MSLGYQQEIISCANGREHSAGICGRTTRRRRRRRQLKKEEKKRRRRFFSLKISNLLQLLPWMRSESARALRRFLSTRIPSPHSCPSASAIESSQTHTSEQKNIRNAYISKWCFVSRTWSTFSPYFFEQITSGAIWVIKIS